MRRDQEMYDVVIVGSGLSGTMLGSILAKHGHRTLLIDGAQHPRFAVGESTIGQTLFLLRLLAHRYGIPEIGHLGSFTDVQQHVGSAHGQKSNFGFVLHRDGEEPDPRETNMFRLLDVTGNAAHFFRQDSDAYMFHVALGYGCEARQNYRVSKVDFEDDRVTVIGADGSSCQARYLIDASGFRSPLAEQLGLREEPSRLKHHARSVFTHMIGVEPADDHLRHAAADQPPVPWHSGTLHHMFDRGWIWVIPFDNHPGATNRLCSVGLQLDPRRYPEQPGLSAEDEFWEHVRRFPAVERQLARARSAREWVRTGRMQYSSTRTVGHRWCLMSHAAGFIDPLFSRGLSNTCELINTLAWRLMAALRDDDFSQERFTPVERLEQGLLDYNDQLVNASYIGFQNYDLWNAVFRIWVAGSAVGSKRFLNALAAAKEAGDDGPLRALDDSAYPGLWCPTDFSAELFGELVAQCEAVDAGRVPAQQAGDTMLGRVRESDWMFPALGLNRPGERFISPTAENMQEVAGWARNHPRPEIRELLAVSPQQVQRTL
ncbi:NAD(P)/FAD-dependent oxidoreductase [Streptomyces boncukensis]|uniref:FAD-dependent oxidoreductase n=1 Tax=Streptomyces boncukensis TaxID=2711219 RepID=A0A6G4WSZ7_9ACTN|nr:tryptophan 7-halogenase [Streptomyces boncukensis]NGO67601.1 FAD-dependent oxidoreductase [Streptomyces boncukensis]